MADSVEISRWGVWCVDSIACGWWSHSDGSTIEYGSKEEAESIRAGMAILFQSLTFEVRRRHRWSGWPGAYCLDCFQADPRENCVSDGHEDGCMRPGCHEGSCPGVPALANSALEAKL
jgi:hypothetical protein